MRSPNTLYSVTISLLHALPPPFTLSALLALPIHLSRFPSSGIPFLRLQLYPLQDSPPSHSLFLSSVIHPTPSRSQPPLVLPVPMPRDVLALYGSIHASSPAGQNKTLNTESTKRIVVIKCPY
ncbi:hypothetical protein BDQ17DRAFT_1437109 [Cyathus striatus]|nr:hypothetical protein BDQ17DRAFT_1437109 [Cyathus striatus]